MIRSRTVTLALALSLGGAALAHDPSHMKDERKAISAEKHAFGREGDPKKVSYTVKIEMSDTMRFSPSLLHVKRGDIVRFDVTNSGKTMHEMVLGTMEELRKHAELMRTQGGMEHGESHMAHIEPGRKQSLVWQFTNAGEFYYACLIPGHFEAGMIGKVVVR